eukprot:c15689_g1_i1 orf=311-793(+)
MCLASTLSRSWIVDSGATAHMTHHRDWFEDFTARSGHVTLGDSSVIPVRGIGSIPIFRSADDKRYISHVLYIPNLTFNLLSVSSLTEQGAEVLFSAGTISIRDSTSGSILAQGVQDGGLFKLMALVSQGTATSSSTLWHARFGHLSYSVLQRAFKQRLVD